MTVRIGQGFDVHAFSDDETRQLVLGGVQITDHRGLHGHSDADVIAHACADALLGAAGLGDIGQHFSDTDPQWKNADSMLILEKVINMVNGDGWSVGNIDLTVICESPKIAPYREEIQAKLSAIVGAPVSVKGKRAEGLGALGRAEGIACFAVTVVEK